MAEIKTKPTEVSVDAFLEDVHHPVRRADGKALRAMMERITGEPAVMWGTSIVGFGSYHYRYDSGHEADMCRVGFSPRSANLVLYVGGFPDMRGCSRSLGSTKAPRPASISTSWPTWNRACSLRSSGGPMRRPRESTAVRRADLSHLMSSPDARS